MAKSKNKKGLKLLLSLRLILVAPPPHFFRMFDNSYFLNVLRSECLSTWDCSWLLIVYLFLWNLKTVCKSPYKYKSLELISNLFQLESDLYCEKRFFHSHWSRARGWSKQKVKIIVTCFSIDYGISHPLFIHLWTLSTAFVLMLVKTGFDTPIFNRILAFLYKSEMISILHRKYNKSITEIILLPTLHAMRIPWYEKFLPECCKIKTPYAPPQKKSATATYNY